MTRHINPISEFEEAVARASHGQATVTHSRLAHHVTVMIGGTTRVFRDEAIFQAHSKTTLANQIVTALSRQEYDRMRNLRQNQACQTRRPSVSFGVTDETNGATYNVEFFNQMTDGMILSPSQEDLIMQYCSGTTRPSSQQISITTDNTASHTWYPMDLSGVTTAAPATTMESAGPLTGSPRVRIAGRTRTKSESMHKIAGVSDKRKRWLRFDENMRVRRAAKILGISTVTSPIPSHVRLELATGQTASYTLIVDGDEPPPTLYFRISNKTLEITRASEKDAGDCLTDASLVRATYHSEDEITHAYIYKEVSHVEAAITA